MRKITILNFSLVLLLSVVFLTTKSQNQMTTSAKLEYHVQENADGVSLKKLPVPDLESSPMISEYKRDLTRAILWTQMTPSDGLIASQDFEASFNAYDCKGADDFVVADGPWTVGIVKFLGGYWNGTGPAQGFNIEFYNNNAGIPGTSIVSFTNLPYTAVAVGTIFEFTVYIPAQVFANGHYWISIQARMDYSIGGQYGWQPHTPPQVQNQRHWINPGGGFGSYTSWTPGTTVWPDQSARDLCFQLETPPACPEPLGLYAADITQTEADLYWTPVGGAVSYNIEVGLQGFTPGTGNEVTGEIGVGDIPWRAKELTSNTVYQFYVQSDCGARSLSDWAGPYTFATLCDPYTNISEGFEGTLFPPLCWSLVAGSGNWARSTLASGYGVGTASARANFYSIQGATPFDLVSPEFNITQAQVTFDHAYATFVDEVDRLRILYSTDGGTNYTLLIELPGGVSGPLVTAPPTTSSFIPTAAQWATKTYALPAGANKVKFQAISAYGNNLYIDNIVIDEAAGCSAPVGLTVSNITASTADLGWTQIGTENGWNVEVGLTGFNPGNNEHVFQAIGTTSNPTTATGLTAGTTYQFYVQADCGLARELSNWSGPYSFTTYCSFECPTGAVAESEPCGEDLNGGCNMQTPAFESVSPGSVICGTLWANNNLRDTDWYSLVLTEPSEVILHAYAEAPVLFGHLNYGAGTPGNPACAVTGFISSTTTELCTVKTLNLGILTAGTHWFFAGLPTFNGFPCDLRYWIEFEVNAVECPPPTNLIALNISSTSADLGWTPGGTETLWNIEWGETGFTLGNGTLISGVADIPYTLSALDPNTAYDFYLQANCGEARTLSPWVGPQSFTTAFTNPTPCGINLGVPDNGCATNNFRDVLIDVSGIGGSQLGVDAVFSSISIIISHTWNSDLDIYLISPNNVMVELSTDNGGSGDNYGNPANCPAQTTTFTMDATTSITVGVSPFIGSYLPEGNLNDFHDGSDPNGIWVLRICDDAAGDLGIVQYVAINISEPPACPKPINLLVNNITATSADLDWTEVGSATLWNLEWGEAGFTQGLGTLVTGITTKPYPLTGLDPNTEYEFYVQSDCGDEARALSEWAGPLAFKTLCEAFNLPFSEDFSGIPDEGFPDCWSVTATGAGNWFVTESNLAGGVSPEMLLIWGSPSFIGTSRLMTPLLNTGGATDFKISLNQFLDDWEDNDGDYIAIEYSVDGGNTWVEIWQLVTDMNYGPAFDEFSFSIPAGNDNFMIAFTFVGNSFNIDGWVIDDVLIVVEEPVVPENRNIDGVANLNDCYDATNTITVTNSTVPNGSIALFKAGVNIIFGDGFVVESGGYMHAEITTVYCNPPALLSVIEEAPAIVLPEITEPTALFKVYPNPTTGLFKMELLGGEDGDINVEIYNMMGERVFQDHLYGSMIYEFNLSNMPKGIYFIRAMRGSETAIEKVIRQ